ncbi:MAG: hypothetical protein NE328_09320 [Lentisphaeraceae bacterium]|nr:hypothetical protein [Lentisphaeraceae bacterium]
MGLKRTTFNESWYRMATLKPSLHPSVKVWRQYYRGELWFVLEDSVNNNFFRIKYPAHQFLGLLDGKRTVDEVWKLSLDVFGDEAPTQGEVISLLGQLYNSNLLLGDIPIDSQGLLKRYKERIQKEVTTQVKGFLFMKIPLFDPNGFLKIFSPFVSWVFTVPGLILWLLAAITGIVYAMGDYEKVFQDTSAVLSPANLPLMLAAFTLSKVLHEFGHGFACKKFGLQNGSGGNVHKFGVMLMLFTPVPFIDCSSAWTFRSRWQRIIVGSAGMAVDLMVAAVSVIIWSQTAEGSVLHALAYNIMFVTSVSTLLFNGNPLMRYDAYYMLSDFLEIPNLSSRSNSYFLYLCKKYILGVKDAEYVTGGSREKFWLILYAISSWLYRFTVMIGIALFIADQIFIGGVLFGLMIIFGMVVKPLYNFTKYLLTDPELKRCRKRSYLVTTCFTTALVFLILIQKFPDRVRIEGVVEPIKLTSVYSKADGLLREIKDHGDVSEGDILCVFENQNLKAETTMIAARIRRLELEYRLAGTQDLVQAQVILRQIKALKEDLDSSRKKLESLNLKAPQSGEWLTEDLLKKVGSYVPRGTEIGKVVDRKDWLIRAVVNQTQAQLINDSPDAIQMRVKGRPEDIHIGQIIKTFPVGIEMLPSMALGYSAGGEVQTRQDDQSGRKASEKFFEVIIEPDKESLNKLLPGQILVIRCDLKEKPLGYQLWRSVKQQFLKRFRVL